MSADREFLVVYGADGDDLSPLSHLAVESYSLGDGTLCGLPAFRSGIGLPDRLPLCPDCQTIALGGAA